MLLRDEYRCRACRTGRARQRLSLNHFGPIDVLIYPFGERPDDAAVRELAGAGHRIQVDIDVLARTVHRDRAVIMSRRHVDGYAFDELARQAPLDDVATVRDPARPVGTLP